MLRPMASRTNVDSVPRVVGPPADVDALEDELDVLRDRFPGAIFERYLDKTPSMWKFVHVAACAAIVG